MANEPDYIVEINGNTLIGPTGDDLAPAGAARPFIAVLFECCSVYQRIYRNPDATAYQGHCPRCLRPLTVRIGPGGTSARTFRAQ